MVRWVKIQRARLRVLPQRHLLHHSHAVRAGAHRRAQLARHALPWHLPPASRPLARQPAEPGHRLQEQEPFPQVPHWHRARHARRHGCRHGHAPLHVLELEGPRGDQPRPTHCARRCRARG